MKKLEKGGKRSRSLDWLGSQYVSGILTGQAAGLGVDPEDIWSSLQKLVCEGETPSEGCMQQWNPCPKERWPRHFKHHQGGDFWKVRERKEHGWTRASEEIGRQPSSDCFFCIHILSFQLWVWTNIYTTNHLRIGVWLSHIVTQFPLVWLQHHIRVPKMEHNLC